MPEVTLDRTGEPAAKQQYPCPHPQPAHHRVLRARQRCSEELDHIAEIRDDISLEPGTPPERRPEYWLDHLRVNLGWLLLTLEDEDAIRR
jgi:hypothetical protein